MHIVQFVPTRVPVPKYGGTQRIVVWLSHGLVELGHDVTLLAPRGSHVDGVRVVEVDPAEVLSPEFDPARHVDRPFDVMHYHCLVKHPPKVPFLATLHGNLGPGGVAPSYVVCVSENHARRHHTASYVYNAVRLDEYEFRPNKSDFDLFLARLHSAKGWRLAVAAAKAERFRLVIAGGWRPSLSRWLKFVGEIGGAQKRELLAGARCLWMPVQWEDPCPVNVLEALASGTPVLATPRGSLPDLVGDDGGGIGASFDDLLALRRRLSDFEPTACRRRAERYFNHLRMTRDYVRMYEHLLQHGELPPGRSFSEAGSYTST
ncbi:MAG TPA: glycosyltransferase [Gemmatimonadales bacterium]|jgi:glycosyltransferase involved in cell wall biosynthesis|nr:glycosyltransferase [Gemmatimonadales bacterium]